MQRRLFLLAPLAAAMTGCAMLDQDAAAQPPVIIFFEGDSARIGDSARELVRTAAATAARYPNASIRVLGFADPEGSPRFNQALSRARAEHVADELAEAGVTRSRIRVSARGPVAFEFAEQESRRVEIRFGG